MVKYLQILQPMLAFHFTNIPLPNFKALEYLFTLISTTELNYPQQSYFLYYNFEIDFTITRTTGTN